jgi:hypothetical protein
MTKEQYIAGVVAMLSETCNVYGNRHHMQEMNEVFGLIQSATKQSEVSALVAKAKEIKTENVAMHVAKQEREDRERAAHRASYCRHGNYIGNPYGADYMCGQCESGY